MLSLGAVGDGAWMAWENSSAATVATVVAHLGPNKNLFPKVLRMGLPGRRNVRSACTKVFRHPISPQVPYDENICFVISLIFSYISPIYPLTPIPYGGPYGISFALHRFLVDGRPTIGGGGGTWD